MESVIVSPNKLMGMLVYRTREALGRDRAFLAGLQEYVFSPNCLVDGRFLFWHYPGTPNEISNVLLAIGEHINGVRLKFPAILNYQPIRQRHVRETTTLYYNLAIVGSVDKDWTTEQREVQVFDLLLRPIYREFMRQIEISGYFSTGYGVPSHDYYEVFTTGGNSAEMSARYGDYVDAIELHGLELKPKSTLCDKDVAAIEKDNENVTKDINLILNF